MSTKNLRPELIADMEKHFGKQEPLDVDNMTLDDIAELRFTWVSEEDSKRVMERLDYLKSLEKNK